MPDCVALRLLANAYRGNLLDRGRFLEMVAKIHKGQERPKRVLISFPGTSAAVAVEIARDLCGLPGISPQQAPAIARRIKAHLANYEDVFDKSPMAARLMADLKRAPYLKYLSSIFSGIPIEGATAELVAFVERLEKRLEAGELGDALRQQRVINRTERAIETAGRDLADEFARLYAVGNSGKAGRIRAR